MKKSIFSILFCCCTNLVLLGQCCFRASEHDYKVEGDTLTVYQQVTFALGSGTTCPAIDSLWHDIKEDSIFINVRYDNRGGWQAFYCWRLDTLVNKILAGNYTLIVNAWTYDYFPETDEVKPVQVDSDTSFAVKVDVPELAMPARQEVRVYPNPASSKLHVESLKGTTDIQGVYLYNMLGSEIKVIRHETNSIDVSDVSTGAYVLKIQTNQGDIMRRLWVER